MSARNSFSFSSVLSGFILALLAWVASAVPAEAQLSREWETCMGNAGTPDDSVSACTRIIRNGNESTSNLAIAYYNRGIMYRRKKDNEAALQDYDEAIRLNPRFAFAWYNRGNIYRDKNDDDRALTNYSEAIRVDPKYANAYNNRGEIHHRRGDYERAISDYSEAIRVNQKHDNAWYNRGLAYTKTGRNERAIEDFRQALKINPQDTDAREELKKLGANE